MRELILREEKIYTPEEVGLETPLLFERLPLYLLFLPQQLAIQVSDIQNYLGQQAVRTQISTICYDRAVIPVWMVKGELPNGFFYGVLKPGIIKNPSQIDVVDDYPKLHFYLELEDLLIVGTGIQDPIWPESILALTKQIDERMVKEEVTPEFEVNFGPLHTSDLSFIRFTSKI